MDLHANAVLAVRRARPGGRAPALDASQEALRVTASPRAGAKRPSARSRSANFSLCCGGTRTGWSRRSHGTISRPRCGPTPRRSSPRQGQPLRRGSPATASTSRSPSTRGGRMTASAETTAEASPHRVYVGGCFASWRSPRVTSTRSPAEARPVRGGEGAARPGRRAPARALPGKGRRPVTAAGLAAPLSEAARLALRDLAEALDCDRASG